MKYYWKCEYPRIKKRPIIEQSGAFCVGGLTETSQFML